MVVARYPARSFISFSVMEEATHLPLESDPAMVRGRGGGEEDENFSGAESLGDWKAEEIGRGGVENLTL